MEQNRDDNWENNWKLGTENEESITRKDLVCLKDSVESSISRIETKMDILAQTDYAELTAFAINGLKDDVAKTDAELEDKLNIISEKMNHLAGMLSGVNNPDSPSSVEDIAFLKENFFRINEKFSEITHLIQTITGESEELNNRFESNLTHFNACFKNIYEQFNSLETIFNNNFIQFKSCIQDVYDQFSTIDTRGDLNQIKLYVQSFSNNFNTIAEIFNTLKNNGFNINIDKIDTLEKKLDILAQVDPCEMVNIFIEESKKTIAEIDRMKADIETGLISKNASVLKENFDEIQSKIEFLNSNLCALLDKLDNDTFEIRSLNGKIFEETQDVKKVSLATLEEAKKFSATVSDEFSALANPLSSSIELTCELRESIGSLIEKIEFSDDLKAKQEMLNMLSRFEELHQSSENNLDNLYNFSKQFYEKLESAKNEFSNVSYETNSKIKDFICKTEHIDLKIQNALSSTENAANTLKNVSEYAQNQINMTGESLNCLKSGLNNLSEEFCSLKNDVSDTGSKLNKIILNEKEHSAAVKNAIEGLKEDFKKDLGELSDNLSADYEKITEKITKNLEKFFEKTSKYMEAGNPVWAETLQTSKDVKNALACMADWFDSAGRILEENNNDAKRNASEISEISAKTESLKKLETLIKKSEEISSEQIKRVSDRLNRFEIRLENIEGKIEKLSDQSGNREILGLLGDIMDRVELVNERSKAGEAALSRLERIEGVLKSLPLGNSQKAEKSEKNAKKYSHDEN